MIKTVYSAVMLILGISLYIHYASALGLPVIHPRAHYAGHSLTVSW